MEERVLREKEMGRVESRKAVRRLAVTSSSPLVTLGCFEERLWNAAKMSTPVGIGAKLVYFKSRRA